MRAATQLKQKQKEEEREAKRLQKLEEKVSIIAICLRGHAVLHITQIKPNIIYDEL